MKTGIALFTAAVLGAFGVSNTAPTPPAQQTNCAAIERVLSFGSMGADVSKLQQVLGMIPTGYFGAQTKQHLIDWQVAKKIIVSKRSIGAGTTGPKTRAALRCQTSPIPPAPAPPIHTTIPTNSASSVPVVAPTQTTTTVAPPPAQNNSAPGGSGSTVAQCPSFTTPMPPPSQCTTGEWSIIANEAGCPAEWDCSDPNATD